MFDSINGSFYAENQMRHCNLHKPRFLFCAIQASENDMQEADSLLPCQRQTQVSVRHRPSGLSFSRGRCSSSHSPTFPRASATGFRATLAMVHLILRALFGAGVACFRAGIANDAREFASSRHIPCRQTANLGAVHIELDAPGHFLHVLFIQARRRAMVACGGASVAFVDAGLELFMSHKNLLGFE